MNQAVVAIIIGLAAAAGGVLLMDSLRGEPAGGSGSTDLGGIEARLEAIEARLPAEGSGGAQLATAGIPPALLDRLEAIERALVERPVTTAAPEGGSAPAGSLARIDERLASIEEKLGGDEASEMARAMRRPAKKRVSLAEAASELELSGAQEDELRRIYDDFHQKMYKMAAGPNGDPEEVKREVAAAAKDPTKAMGLVGKYMPNIMNNIGGMMQAQQQRQEAIDKLLGPEKSRKLRRNYDVKEDNILGLGGARSEFRMEAR
ncbi:MAG: hypothetical protein QNJ90_15030 [Planctomycetota bacterium]|nr:hypothetical protein [Planctomycetota bacterium]